VTFDASDQVLSIYLSGRFPVKEILAHIPRLAIRDRLPHFPEAGGAAWLAGVKAGSAVRIVKLGFLRVSGAKRHKIAVIENYRNQRINGNFCSF
jgi:hypothetical protein